MEVPPGLVYEPTTQGSQILKEKRANRVTKGQLLYFEVPGDSSAVGATRQVLGLIAKGSFTVNFMDGREKKRFQTGDPGLRFDNVPSLLFFWWK